MSLLLPLALTFSGEPIIDAMIKILIIIVILAIVWWLISLIPESSPPSAPFSKPALRLITACIAGVAMIVILVRLL